MTSSSRRRGDPPAAGAAGAQKHSIYARFIPREELTGFAAWAPHDISGPTEAPQAPAQHEPEPAVAVEQQLRQARQSGYQDGYRDGLVALEGFKQSFAQQTTRQIGVLLQSVGSQLDALQEEMARAVAATAVRLAAQVVRSELDQNPALVARVAEEAIDALLLNARHLVMRVHPEDLPLITQGAGDVIAARGVRLIADPAIARGGCLVDSDIGGVDATLQSRWRRAAAALGHEAEAGALAGEEGLPT